MISARTARAYACALAAALALASCKSSTGSSDASGDSFSSNTLAQYTGYGDGGANWSITGGQLVGTGPANQSVLVRNGVRFTDGWVEAVSPGADDGGLVLRFQSGSDYYLLAFRDDAAPDPRGTYNLAMYHRNGADYDQMWVGNVVWPRGTVHTRGPGAARVLRRGAAEGADPVAARERPGAVLRRRRHRRAELRRRRRLGERLRRVPLAPQRRLTRPRTVLRGGGAGRGERPAPRRCVGRPLPSVRPRR